MEVTRENLLERLADEPLNVYARSALLDGGAIIDDPGGTLIISRDRRLISVIGRPSARNLGTAIAGCAHGASLLAGAADKRHSADILGDPGTAAWIHELGQPEPSAARTPEVHVSLLANLADTYPDSAIEEELHEQIAAGHPVSAVVCDGVIASCCYAAATTERYWDVSIDTHEAYRRRGFATQAFLHHYAHRKATGLVPVWGAVVDNPASLALAAKLGFVRAGQIWEFLL